MTDRPRIAIYGGSFNPPHMAHVFAVIYALKAFECQGVRVLPVFKHAFDKELLPFAERVRLCELAFAGMPGVEISTIEAELPAPNFTLHTLQELKRRFPHEEQRLLIGSDTLFETERWHAFAEVERLAPPLVLSRPGYPHHAAASPALPNISSSQLREALAARTQTEEAACIRQWLPAAVRRYIEEQQLYT